MSQLPDHPAPAMHPNGFTGDGGSPAQPGRRPGAITVAGIAMLAFAGLVALQLSAQWAEFLMIDGSSLRDYVDIIGFPWEITLCAIIVTLALLATLVLFGGHRARFAAITLMGALLIEAVVVLSVVPVTADSDDGLPLLFGQNAIHVVGLGLAATAVVLLAKSTSTQWFDRRQLTRSPVAEPVSRPSGLVVAVVGLTAVALYRAFTYVSYMFTVTGDELFTRAESLTLETLYQLPQLIVLAVAVIGLYFGSGLARVAAYVASGGYCFGAAVYLSRFVRDLILRPPYESVTVFYLLEGLLIAAVVVTSLVALSRPRTVAWFRARREATPATATG